MPSRDRVRFSFNLFVFAGSTGGASCTAPIKPVVAILHESILQSLSTHIYRPMWERVDRDGGHEHAGDAARLQNETPKRLE